MMRNLWGTLAALFIGSFTLLGADFRLTCGKLSATVDTRGGSLSSLAWNNKSLHRVSNGRFSFTDQVFNSQGNIQFMEDFSQLQFKLHDLSKSQAQFSALGVKGFNWLRITKTYQLSEDRLNIKWELKNISGQPQRVGLWNRTFLRRHESGGLKNKFFIPQRQKLTTLVHPGNIAGDQWFLSPDRPALGFCGVDDKLGAIILLPQNLPTCYYSYLSGKSLDSTLEWFLREQTIAPHQSVQFTISVIPGTDVAEQLQKNLLAFPQLVSGTGAPALLPELFTGKNKKISMNVPAEGPLKPSVKFMDIHGKRQFSPSIRSVSVPAKFATSTVAVYELANHRPEYDRPIPCQVEKCPDGGLRILIRVPGISPHGFYHTRIVGNWAYDRLMQNKFLGETDFAYRICLDQPNASPARPELFADGVNLQINGQFERQAPAGDYPEGFFRFWIIRNRHNLLWVNEGVNQSKCARIFRPDKSRYLASLPLHFRVEPGVKYHFSCRSKIDNPIQKYLNCNLTFWDANGKLLPMPKQWIFLSKKSQDWKIYQRSFYAPPQAEFAQIDFLVPHSQQTMWVDDIKMVAEDFHYLERPVGEVLRDEVQTRYSNLKFLEDLSPEIVTPHVPWLINSHDKMPQVLYLPMASGGGIENTERRQIIEIAQRLDLTYQYIPLLRKMTIKKTWGGSLGNELEKYTIWQLKNLQKIPPVIIVQAVDFKKHVQKEFVEILRKFQQKGANFLFYNCRHVPQVLLGRPQALPEGIFTTPQFRKVAPSLKKSSCSYYVNGKSKSICFQRNSNLFYLEAFRFESTPQKYVHEKCPAYYGREFPYWEYIYLPLLKSLRHLGIKKLAVQVMGQDQTTASIKVQAQKNCTAQLKLIYRNMNRLVNARQIQPVQLVAGSNRIKFPVPKLPGGTQVVDYWLLDEQKRVYDCGSLTFQTPQNVQIQVKFAAADKVFVRGQPMEFTVKVTACPKDSILKYRISDSNRRVVAQGTAPVQKEQKFAINLLPPFTTLYHLDISVWHQKRELAQNYQEFSLPQSKDPYQLDALIWNGREHLVKVYANLGFTMSIVNCWQNGADFGRFRALRSCDVEPVSIGGGLLPGGQHLKYRSDAPTAPVRNPCYSNPEYWKMYTQKIGRHIKESKYRYYGVNLFFLGDESYLGSSVCYSPYCLAAFRQEMQRQYGSLQALNRTWGTAFKAWNDVTPCQLKALKNSYSLAPWLDHKLFMAKIFAEKWVGKTGEIIRQFQPGGRVGLSGTQIPGLSYDWFQLMKHLDLLGYYGGIQRKVVHDFARQGFLSGQWGGGYFPAEEENEFYQKSVIWDDMLQGANLVCNFATNHSFNGDFRPVANTRYYAELVRELRQGAGRMILHSREVKREIAVVYSQASIFAAMGALGSTIWHNSQNGWHALLGDLGYSYFWLADEDLGKRVPQAKVVVLPATFALSDQAAANLTEFVRRGGMVIADFAPGWYDNHGRRNLGGQVEKLFGISRRQSEFVGAYRKFCLTASAAAGIPEFTGNLPCGESGLQSAGAKAWGHGEHAGILWLNSIGRGQAILLNMPLSSYQEINLGGVGGETSAVKSGNAHFCQLIRQLISGILNCHQVKPNSIVTDCKTKQRYHCGTSLRQDGANYVFVIHKAAYESPDGRYPMRFNAKFARNLQIKLPVSGYWYDVRNGKYLAQGDQVNCQLIPGDGKIFSILPAPIRQVKITAPSRVSAGRPVTVEFAALGAVGNQVFRLTLSDPSGKINRHYDRNGYFSAEGGRMTFQTAFNDLRGVWTLQITHLNSGIKSVCPLTIE